MARKVVSLLGEAGRRPTIFGRNFELLWSATVLVFSPDIFVQLSGRCFYYCHNFR